MESNRWLSDDEAACREMLDTLKEQYPAWQAEFTFPANNRLLCALLTKYGAKIFPEQLNMRLDAPPTGIDTQGVELLSASTMDQYLTLHQCSDSYWTGEMVTAKPETFRVLVSLEGNHVAGYLDVTYSHDPNNISDLYVQEQHRRQGHGTRLLAKAAELSASKALTLQVDIDNSPAVRLYQRVGFRTLPDKNTVDAIWQLP